MSNSYITFPLAEATARKLIEIYSIKDITKINIEDFSLLIGIYVRESELRGAAAHLIRNEKNGIITVNSLIKEPGRKRFAIAHEIGHFLLHENINQIKSCTDKDLLDIYKTRKEEPEANRFATELLMPFELYQQYSSGFKPTFINIENLSVKFGTSLTATSIRYVELTRYPCILIASENNKIKWFKRSKDFQFYIKEVGKELDEDSCAHEFFSSGILPIEPEKVIGDIWLQDYKNKDEILIEDTRALTSYGTVLSLISLHDK